MISSFAGYPTINAITKLPKHTQLGPIENVNYSTITSGQDCSNILYKH
jgi:hypothetical protein